MQRTVKRDQVLWAAVAVTEGVTDFAARIHVPKNRNALYKLLTRQPE
jgi:hypothetical protein